MDVQREHSKADKARVNTLTTQVAKYFRKQGVTLEVESNGVKDAWRAAFHTVLLHGNRYTVVGGISPGVAVLNRVQNNMLEYTM